MACIIICTAADREAANLVLEENGRGPDSLSRALCAVDPLATPSTPATHYLMQDMSATGEDIAQWEALVGFPVLGIYPLGEGADVNVWRDGVLGDAGLQFVPDAW